MRHRPGARQTPPVHSGQRQAWLAPPPTHRAHLEDLEAEYVALVDTTTDADKAEIPADIFRPQAERRVRLGLVVAELVRAHGLQARPEQLQAHIEEASQSYEKPAEVMRWYLGDRQRMAEVEALVVENNLTEFVLARAQVSDRALPFDELMTPA